MKKDDKYIMWLTAFEHISPAKKIELLKNFETAERIFNANKTELERLDIFSEKTLNKLLEFQKEEIIKNLQEDCEKNNINFISYKNTQYPKKLFDLEDYPIGLFVLGEIPKMERKSVAVIGARRCSEYGTINAYKFAKDLAKEGVVVVSGMAMGIDGKAHKGCLDGGGKTIAVLGCGADVIYPTVNTDLRNQIIKNGCVISEYPPRTEPLKSHFPQRNRLISAFSDVVCVIEATKKSGTFITVNQALELGRDIFAMPGNITSIFSKGCNELIKNGAYPLTELEDILFTLDIEKYKPEDKNIKNKFQENFENNFQSLAPDEKMLYDCIGLEPITIQELLIKTKSQLQTIQYILIMLELKGYIQKLSGEKYIRSL